jgi:hypothetical protein
MRRQEHVPISLLTGELRGAIVGLLGGYERSRRRVRSIRGDIIG